MPSIKKSIQVSLPLNACWDAVSNLELLPDWDTRIQTVTTLGSDGIGQRIDLQVAERRVYAFMTRYNPPHEFAFQYVRWIVTWEIRYQLEPYGSQTHLQRTCTAKGVAGWLVWYWQREKINQQERDIALRTKDILDGSSIL